MAEILKQGGGGRDALEGGGGYLPPLPMHPCPPPQVGSRSDRAFSQVLFPHTRLHCPSLPLLFKVMCL